MIEPSQKKFGMEHRKLIRERNLVSATVKSEHDPTFEDIFPRFFNREQRKRKRKQQRQW
jgi:hypothetical protein